MIERRRLLAGGARLAVLPSLPARAALPVPTSGRLGFDVMREGSKLGMHSLTFQPSSDGLTVQVAVDLVYKVAGIALYRYTHRATEIWRGDDVVSIDSQTDDNGERHRVSGRREAAGLVVQGTKAARYTAPADALPATHWNRRELEVPWINTQDGRLMRPVVSQQGVEVIPTVGGTTQARRYALTGDVQLDMFYDDHGWAGLAFVKSGTPIRYERTS